MRGVSSITQKGLLVVGLVLVLQLGFFAVLYRLLADSQSEIWHESHVKSVLMETDALIISVFEATAAVSAYAETRSSHFKRKTTAAIDRIPIQMKLLRGLVRGFPEEEQAVMRIEELATRALGVFRRAETALDDGNQLMTFMAPREYQTEAEAVLLGLAEELQQFTQREKTQQSLFSQRQSASRTSLQQVLLIATICQAAIAIAVSVAFLKGITNRVGALVENTHRLAKKQTLHPPVQGSDEIAYLDKVFHQMADSLAAAEKAKEEFVSVISHELRSPLSSIRGTLNLLEAGAYGELTDQGRDRVNNAELNATRLIALINELLEIKKLEAGKMRMEFEPFPLDEIATRAVQTVQVLAERKATNIELSISDKPLEIYADPRRLEQVILNLLTNAVKYSPDSGSIEMSVIKSGGWVELRVTDHGDGIPESYLETVFEKFEQVERKSDSASTGLGLPISRAIIEAHGGTIGVDSKIGQGSTFWFRIPAVAPEETAIADGNAVADASR